MNPTSRRRVAQGLPGLAAATLAAAAPVLASDDSCAQTPPAGATVVEHSPVADQPVAAGMETLVAAAVADLAIRLAFDASVIEVLSAEELTWSDAGLGCPQPGMRYPQVPVDGYRIRLKALGRVFAYHGGDQRGPFLCELPARQPEPEQHPRPTPSDRPAAAG